MKELSFKTGWHILQDVHDTGEMLGLFKADWNPTYSGHQFSEWEPIERLGHLQTILSGNPYFGRELRHFNNAPWWYKNEFFIPEAEATGHAALRFEGVDYYCKVWLNEQLVGEHEGYGTPFEFEVGHLLKTDAQNSLFIKVWSPWDEGTSPGHEKDWSFSVERKMAKGTYEHSDTFVQRDVNPIGIYGDVKLKLHPGVRYIGKPHIASKLADDASTAGICINVPLSANIPSSAGGTPEITICSSIYCKETGMELDSTSKTIELGEGQTEVVLAMSINSPKLWNTWDRGGQHLYVAKVSLNMNDCCIEESIQNFGIRTVELVRSAEETTYRLNGKKLFIRGTAYFPDVYTSNMHEARYRRDLELIRNAGFNAVRVHVHTPRPVFYDICDELGLAVMQDFDINWKHVEDEAWGNNIVKIFADLIREYRNYACIVTWVCTNEPSGGIKGYLLTTSPAPQLVAEAKRLDPDRPTIKGSGAWGDDLENGDTHNYIGSLDGRQTHYTDMYERLVNKWNFTEKLNTEFGFDAPGCKENLRTIPQVYKRLKPVMEEGIDELQYYQYRLLKYYIEHYRVHKYAPNSGYFQFMFIDLCPQSFYGVYDWWGIPKGGLKALQESNNPMGILMYYKDKPGSVHVVNDLLEAYPDAVVEWIVTDDIGTVIDSGSLKADITEDSIIKITDLSFKVDDAREYKVCLYLKDSSGRLLAKNIYNNAFHHPAHPKGHPDRMSHETGMRLYWA